MIWRSVLFVMLLAACASPDYIAPPADAARIEMERRAAIHKAMDTALQRRARVYDLAWPVLTENIELCPTTRPAIGVVLADRPMLARLSGGLRDEELAEIGIEERLILAHVHYGSPADAAGLITGMVLREVEGEAVSSPKDAAKLINVATEESGSVLLTVGEDKAARQIEVAPVERCDMAVKISTRQQINAHAYSGDIVIMTGIIRSLNDEALKFLIAHEAAHLAAGHRRKYVQNTVTSGAVLAGPLLYPMAILADRMAAIGEPPDVSFRARTLKILAPWAEDFEEEADYLGLYMFARAGGDLAQARELFDVFSREVPSSIYLEATHPLTPERLSRLEAAIQEIEARQAAGEELLPTTRKR